MLSLGLTTVMSVGAFGVAIPALAAPTVTAAADCSGNRTCTYKGGVNHDGGSYNGFLGSRTPGTTLENISVDNRNRLSSWINYTSTGARFYYNTNGNGTCVPMYANDRASATASNPDDNEAESWAFTRTC